MPKRKTHEEFIKELYNLVGNEYLVLDEYKNSQTKIIFIHNTNCKHQFKMIPNNFLKGQRCPKCKKLLRYDTQSFIQRIHDLVGDEYTVIGDYKNAHTHVELIHNIPNCKHKFKSTPTAFINNGRRCPKCFGSLKLTQDVFEKRIKELVKDEYEVLGKYINSRTPIEMKHNICNYEWFIQPSSFLSGCRCPNCYGNIKKTTVQFKKEVYDLVGNNYMVLGEYVNSHTNILMKHENCDHIYEITPTNFLKGTRCPLCDFGKMKTTKEFKSEVFELVGNEYEVLGEYIGANFHVEMRHTICNHRYNVKPSGFLIGRRCPICRESKGEKRIRKWLEENYPIFESQKEFLGLVGVGGGNLSYDFYLPKQNILIEYQGEFHDGSGADYTRTNLKNQQEHDKRKGNYVKDHGIKLLEIWYWDFDNVEEILEREISKYKEMKEG